MSKKQPCKNIVQLAAYTTDGQLVLEQDLTLTRFYEDSHPVLDDPEYRKARQIVRLRGTMRNAHGAISREFDVRFDPFGRCMGDAARFADGSVVGDWDVVSQRAGCK